MRLERETLQEAMWSGAGLSRDAAGLTDARTALAGSAVPAPLDVRTLEDANLLTCALALIDAALARTGSVGAHHRTDSPDHVAAPAAERGRTDPHSARRPDTRREAALPC